MPEQLRIFNYGGGVQSTAALVLAARGRIDFRTFLMANVGDDSEDPRTMAYVRNVAVPYAAKHGIDLHILDRVKRDGSVETLWQRMAPEREWVEEGKHTLREPIPVRGENGNPMGRACTQNFKTQVTAKWAKEHGARAPRPCKDHTPTDVKPRDRWRYARPACADCYQGNKAVVALGISLDEVQRANTSKAAGHEVLTYPLIGVGEETGLTMTRQDCIALITDEGLPVPPKSSCFFCPFHSPAVWIELRRTQPALFERSLMLERRLIARRAARGKPPVYLTRFGKPLDEVIAEPEAMLPGLGYDEADCDSGACFL